MGATNTYALVYSKFDASLVTEADIESCARLFSHHYGVWGDCGPKPDRRVSMSAMYMRYNYLFDDTCSLITAKNQIGELIGHAFVCTFWYTPGEYFVSWITQLVVRSDSRNRGVAKKICGMALDASYGAWGLVTSHPHAVRALERSTDRLCDHVLIGQSFKGFIEQSKILYMQNSHVHVDSGECTVDTQFHIDHMEVNRLIDIQNNWTLGQLPDGHEFIAFTFAQSTTLRQESVNKTQT